MYGKAIGFANMTTAELEAAAQSYNDKVSKANQESDMTGYLLQTTFKF